MRIAAAQWLAVLLMLVSRTAAADPAPGSRATVFLVTLGDFPPALGDAVAQAVHDELQVTIRRIDRVPLPASAWYGPRRRYRADRILEHLHEVMAARAPEAPPDAPILAMTDADISTTKGRVRDWGVFGLGEIGGRASVISMFRLKRGARDAAHVRFRIATTAIHEVGHTLGLPHCVEARCAMQDAEGSVRNTDSGTGRLGAGCRALLDRVTPVR